MPLNIFVADGLVPLADRLAERLDDPLDDPLQPELVAVPSVGLQRWLRLQLASTLGAEPGAGDGIAANIDMPFPGVLRSRLFAADLGGARDPWQLRNLVWAVYQTLVANHDDQGLESIVGLPAGATLYGRARRIADLFDRYGNRRADLLRRWARGEDVDPTGEILAKPNLWQPQLFRLLRAHLGVASPAERLPGLLADVRADTIELDLPDRFSIFGVSSLPGGPDFADLLRALGEYRCVDLYMLDPAPATTTRLIEEFGHIGELKRSEDHSGAAVRQPLLRSWGRPSREARLLLRRLGLPDPRSLPAVPAPVDGTLLASLQRHLGADAPPTPNHTLSGDDRSIEVHACPGPMRQIEVLRDVILGALADDPSLEESDVLVVCPDLATFAPLIPAALGPSTDSGTAGRRGPPRVRYTITDREVRIDDALPTALMSLVRLVGGRYTASEVLDFCGRQPVADAFMFDTDALHQIERWLGATEIRWGLNETNRTRNGLPNLPTNTWCHGLDQLLVGMAVHDDQPVLGPGRVPALGVEGGGVDVLDKLMALIHRLVKIEEEWNQPAPLHEWNARLSNAVTDFFQLPFSEQWQIERVRAAIADVVADAELAHAGSVELSVREVAQLLDESLSARPARPRFFDGAITFTSLRPLRWVPHRMICILGLDEDAMERRSVNGDDLLGNKPDLGDPDRRADQRQSLLEVVLSAGDKLVITRTGRDIRSNSDVPHSIAVAELLTEIASIVDPGSSAGLRRQIERFHPRHSFALENFDSAKPFSFDPCALDAARAKARRVDDVDAATILDPPHGDVIELADLGRVVVNAPKFLIQDRLQASFPGVTDVVSDNLPVARDALLNWQTLTECIDRTREYSNVASFVNVIRARGSFPAGPAGDDEVIRLTELAEAMVDTLDRLGVRDRGKAVSVDLAVDGHRFAGRLEGVHEPQAIGPIRITASAEDDRQLLPLWLDLCALTLLAQETPWRAILVSRKGAANSKVSELSMRGESSAERAARASHVLIKLVDLHRRALREPLPILAKVGVAGTTETPYLKGWDDRFGMQRDAYVLAAYGKLSGAELLDVRADPADPGDPLNPSRFLRFRGFLEELRENSVTTRELR